MNVLLFVIFLISRFFSFLHGKSSGKSFGFEDSSFVARRYPQPAAFARAVGNAGFPNSTDIHVCFSRRVGLTAA